MARAEGTFTVKSWDESTYQELEGNGKLTKAAVGFTFEGDLAGEASWDAVMCYRPDGTAVFTGYQHTIGRLGGREGSFVLRGDGEYANGQARTTWEVVRGSGSGALAGLTGSGSAVASATPPGTFTFDYDLG